MLTKNASFYSLKNKTWVEKHIAGGMWIFIVIIMNFLLYFVSYTPYVDLFKLNEYK